MPKPSENDRAAERRANAKRYWATKETVVISGRQNGKTEAMRLEALNAAYAKAYDSVHSPGKVLLDELRARGFDVVRK